jgi:phosphatidylserine/phosphatidylglycerophosphate/cardiolipin synthase-like enzyme
VDINCFFSSTDNISEIITSQILNAKINIFLAMYTLTDRGLIDALKERRQNGIDILSIFDEAQLTKFSNIIFELNNADIVFKTIGKAASRMHHKFLIIDKNKVITGSFNWTHQANKSNMENIIIVENQNIVKKYMDEFDRIWQLISSKNIKDYFANQSNSKKNQSNSNKMNKEDIADKYLENIMQMNNKDFADEYVESLLKDRHNYSLTLLRDKLLKDLQELERKGLYKYALKIVDYIEKTNLTQEWEYIAEFKRTYQGNSI